MKTNPLGCKEVAIDAGLKGHLLRYIHYEYTQLPNQTGTLSMDGSNLRHTDLCDHSNSTYLSAKNEFIDRCTRSVSGKPLAFLSIAAATQGKESSSRLPTNLRKTVAGLLLLTTLWTLFQYLSISRSMIGGVDWFYYLCYSRDIINGYPVSDNIHSYFPGVYVIWTWVMRLAGKT